LFITRAVFIQRKEAIIKSHIMTVIKQDDLIESVAAALQFISYYHPADYIAHLARAYEAEQSPAAKDAIAQILTTRACAPKAPPYLPGYRHRQRLPENRYGRAFEGFSGSIIDAVNEGVPRYNLPTTSCAHPSLLTRSLNAKTPKTTRQPWCTWNWFRNTVDVSRSQRRRL
jgi:hypothetical protein